MLEPLEISAPVDQVWRLLREEAQTGVDSGHLTILTETRHQELLIEVAMGLGFRVQHAYRLTQRGAGCRVEDRVRPLGWRWRLSNVFLAGRGLRPIEAAAMQGLHNLKDAAETDSA